MLARCPVAGFIFSFVIPLWAEIGGCPVFPRDNIWNTPIDTLPVDANSAAYIATIGSDKPLHADFGSGIFDGGPIGIPFITVASGQVKVPVCSSTATRAMLVLTRFPPTRRSRAAMRAAVTGMFWLWTAA